MRGATPVVWRTPARPQPAAAGQSPAHRARARTGEPLPPRTGGESSSWGATRRRRRDWLHAYELEAEVAHTVKESEQLSLVGDLAHQCGLAASELERHALKRRREALSQTSAHRNPVPPGRHDGPPAPT